MKTLPVLSKLSCLVIAGFAVTTLWTARTANGSERGQKYALLVGINDYSAPFQDLEFCHNDMEELRDVLIAAGFAKENVVYMHDGATESAYYPSKINLMRQLELRLGLANEQDLVVVVFSGHGLLENQVSYLCPGDAALDNLAATCVSMEQIYERMESCRAGQKIILVDACRNERPFRGIRSGSGIRGFAAELQEPPKGLRVLSSCEAGQWSAEDPELEHGVFMYYVTRGLQGKADQECEGNSNGRVSLDELYAYAHQRTKTHVAKSHGILQRPWMKGEVVGVYEIGTVIGGVTEERAAHDLRTAASGTDVIEEANR